MEPKASNNETDTLEKSLQLHFSEISKPETFKKNLSKKERLKQTQLIADYCKTTNSITNEISKQLVDCLNIQLTIKGIDKDTEKLTQAILIDLLPYEKSELSIIQKLDILKKILLHVNDLEIYNMEAENIKEELKDVINCLIEKSYVNNISKNNKGKKSNTMNQIQALKILVGELELQKIMESEGFKEYR